jgi:hypothetical protein
MLKYHDFQCQPTQLYIFEKKKKKIINRDVGSSCKPVEMLNRSAGSG